MAFQIHRKIFSLGTLHDYAFHKCSNFHSLGLEEMGAKLKKSHTRINYTINKLQEYGRRKYRRAAFLYVIILQICKHICELLLPDLVVVALQSSFAPHLPTRDRLLEQLLLLLSNGNIKFLDLSCI